ncbi:type I-MYXAN CRISPR-associated protein Cas6/Cmx6 [Thalassoroseus pseudoceratinae]|uniref:type I-MYXAN CRISPR-associated protein Cas6/Cmx6 n=1 Tax=Thalassoroseus pseudoceratinae TaxID=2713176 RepID=UPI00142481C1|nr:type I-MYXAN CRISPR-associated protein Cas6/Cmx6 [Thalassoroseus pseudoceratinae]
MSCLDIRFTLTTQKSIPSDHGYFLYSAISRVLPEIHASDGIAVHPITGRQTGGRLMAVMPWSSLTLRVPDGRVGEVLPLAGQSLRIGEATLHVGVPQVAALRPTSALRSRSVTIKLPKPVTDDDFAAAVRRQLDALDVSSQTIITLVKRRTLRIKQREIIGYEVLIEGLTAEESLAVQSEGIGGRRKLGCGVFVPVN